MEQPLMQAVLAGFMMQMGMIMSLGMQNMYVIQKGLKREFPMAVAAACCICEIFVMTVGVFGAGKILSRFAGIETYLVSLAAIFLLIYGLRSIWKSIQGGVDSLGRKEGNDSTIWGSILAAIGFSVLNPQAIVESVVFFGGVAPKFGNFAPYFVAGAIIASFIWLFSLAFITSTGKKEPSIKTLNLLEGVSGGILFIIGLGMMFS